MPSTLPQVQPSPHLGTVLLAYHPRGITARPSRPDSLQPGGKPALMVVSEDSGDRVGSFSALGVPLALIQEWTFLSTSNVTH